MQEVADGVYQIEVPMRRNPLGYTYSYLLREAATIIDTGVGTRQAFTGLSEQLRSAGMDVTEVRRIILTHLHGDHMGLVDSIRPLSGATVRAHRVVDDIQKGMTERGEQLYDDTRNELKLLGGGSYLGLIKGFERARRRPRRVLDIDELVDDGDILHLEGSTLKIYWTPGHAREHICLFDEEREILYSGDHVLPKITSHISLHTYQEGDTLSDYLESLERLRGLPVKSILPAHEHIFKDLDGRITALQLHHAKRCKEIMESIGDCNKTVFQISSKVSWDSRPWPQMAFWTKRMAAAETYAHLVYLRNKGEIREEKQKGVLYYSRIK